MTDVTDIVTQLKIVLSALPDVDYADIDGYEPAIVTQKVALMIVPFQQSGAMKFGRLGPHVRVHAHRICCEFWIKVDVGDTPTAMQRGRDICTQAMRLLANNYQLGGTVMQIGSSLLGEQSLIGQYEVLQQGIARNGLPYLIARLFVMVEVQETV